MRRRRIAAHPLSLDLHPVVTLSCASLSFAPLRLTVKLVADVQFAVLAIARGRLTAINAADLSLSATLFYSAHRLAKLASKKVGLASPHLLPGQGWTIVGD